MYLGREVFSFESLVRLCSSISNLGFLILPASLSLCLSVFAGRFFSSASLCCFLSRLPSQVFGGVRLWLHRIAASKFATRAWYSLTNPGSLALNPLCRPRYACTVSVA